MTEPRRSRTAWPGPISLDGAEHELPEPLVSRVKLLTRAVVVLAVFVLVSTAAILLIVLDRGKLRVEEDRRIACALADTFPADSPSLERLRAKYGCGPGIPRNLLTPEELERLDNAVPAPVPAPLAPQSFDGGAVSPSPRTHAYRIP